MAKIYLEKSPINLVGETVSVGVHYYLLFDDGSNSSDPGLMPAIHGTNTSNDEGNDDPYLHIIKGAIEYFNNGVSTGSAWGVSSNDSYHMSDMQYRTEIEVPDGMEKQYWDTMVEKAIEIELAQFHYSAGYYGDQDRNHGYSINSSSFIASVLSEIGISLQEVESDRFIPTLTDHLGSTTFLATRDINQTFYNNNQIFIDEYTGQSLREDDEIDVFTAPESTLHDRITSNFFMVEGSSDKVIGSAVGIDNISYTYSNDSVTYEISKNSAKAYDESLNETNIDYGDNFYGSNHDDTFKLFNLGEKFTIGDFLSGGAGIDILDIEDYSSNVTIEFDGNDIGQIITPTNLFGLPVIEYDINSFEKFKTGTGNDTIIAQNKAHLIETGAGNDEITIDAQRYDIQDPNDTTQDGIVMVDGGLDDDSLTGTSKNASIVLFLKKNRSHFFKKPIFCYNFHSLSLDFQV